MLKRLVAEFVKGSWPVTRILFQLTQLQTITGLDKKEDYLEAIRADLGIIRVKC